MTFQELEDSLPNGLHDAEVHSISVNYVQRVLTIDLAVWVGNMNQSPEVRETYREASIRLSGLYFFVAEAPDPKYPFAEAEGLRIDGCDRRERLSEQLVGMLPSDLFLRSVWVNEWNAFMHIAAREASFEWRADAAVRAKS